MQVRLRAGEGGKLEVFTSFGGSSGMSSSSWSPEFVEALADRWDELEIETPMGDQPFDWAKDDAIIAMKISVPEKLKADLASLLKKRKARKLDDPLLFLVVGSEAGADRIARKIWPERSH